MSSPPRIAIVGATGAVGRELLRLLEEASHPASRVSAWASPTSAGTHLSFAGTPLVVGALGQGAFEKADVVVFATPAAVARRWAPAALDSGALVVDTSSAHRRVDGVPLVVPEVNGTLLARPGTRLVANPNCASILLTVALEPIRRALGLRHVVVSTYQAVSGAGAHGMRELQEQTRAVLDGRVVPPDVFPHPCAFNVFPHESAVDPSTGRNGEEEKLVVESRRILQDPLLSIVPTCVRVPVLRSHCLSVTVETERAASLADLRALLAAADGVYLHADQAEDPTALAAAGKQSVHVGRVRAFPGREGARGAGETARTFALWIAGDQLRKGAAGNALQIVEALVGRARLRSSAAESEHVGAETSSRASAV